MYVWRNLVFQTTERSYLWSLYLRMLGRGLGLKTTTLLVFLLQLEVFEKLVNNRLKIINSTITSIITSTLKCDLSSDFQQRFRSSRSTTDLLTVTPDRTARAFNRNRATRAVALNNSKTFGKARHAGHLHKQVLWNFRSGMASFHSFSVLGGFE